MQRLTLALCADQGFPLWMSMAAILRGWALAEQGQQSKGIEQMRQGLSQLRETGGGTLAAIIPGLAGRRLRQGGQF